MRVGIAVLCLVVACGGESSSSECGDGETRSCYRGSASTRGIGACSDGVESCAGGRWSGVCLGDVTPFIEKCNGVDEDCNGEVDDVEGTGEACNGADGCVGARGCSNGVVACLSPGKNECGVCGGAEVSGLGTTCANEVCSGSIVCAIDGESTTCNAPQQNACELCGGPAITGLGDACVATSGCDGARVCNAGGTNTTCSCNPVPGMCLANGTLRAVVAPLPGDLVITEVMPNPEAVDDTLGEWIEVRVTRDIDLNQVALDRAGDTAAPNIIESANCLRVTAGTNLVFARNVDPAMNGGLPAVSGRFTFTLVTTAGDVRVLYEGAVLDAITWATSTTGKSVQLDPDLIDIVANDAHSNFCDGATAYGIGADLGTPAAANTQCATQPPAGSCLDGGVVRAIVKPAAGQLQITELLANPATLDATREWFEIANTGAAAFDLNDLTVADANDTSTIASSSCITIGAGALGLVARSNDVSVNGPLPAPDATFNFALVDSTGTVEVRDGTTVLDAVTWTSVASGVARALDPAAFTLANNNIANAAPWCAATASYGDATNKGTPRAANAACP